MEIANEETKKSWVEKVKVQYDMLPKYCGNCKLQGHNALECRVLPLELQQVYKENRDKELEKGDDKEEGELEDTATRGRADRRSLPRQNWNPTRRRFIKEPNKIQTQVSFTLEKNLCTSNSFDLLAVEDERNGNMDDNSNNITSVVKTGGGNQEITTKDWVSKSFLHPQGEGRTYGVKTSHPKQQQEEEIAKTQNISV
uniref:Putative ovule protein n=1 Tax=Solanum chacoense TaxID=4108 RepID=A0A0V0HU19_SOLCH